MHSDDLLIPLAKSDNLKVTLKNALLRDEELRWLVEGMVDFDVISPMARGCCLFAQPHACVLHRGKDSRGNIIVVHRDIATTEETTGK